MRKTILKSKSTPAKQIIVIGDIEMGAGNLTDDFISDKALSQLIHSFAEKKHPIDLVLNGDTLDFLKCPYLDPHTNKLTYPRHITAAISLGKLKLIYEAHKRVFSALNSFVSSPHHHLYFIIGNHDHDLFFPEIKETLKQLLDNKKSYENIHFPGLHYHKNNVWVEHGQQYDFICRVNFRNLFVSYKGEHILNFPWMAFGLISQFMDMKEEHPFLERIFPRQLLFSLHRMVLKKISLRSLGYFLKSVLYFPFRYYSDPTYSFPSWLFSEFYRRIMHNHWDIDEIMGSFRRKKASKTKAKIFVLGHIHRKHIDERRKQTIIHPGSWRDEYILDAKKRTLVPKKKHYVQITLQENDEPSYEVPEYPIERTAFLFDEVRKNELAYVYLAAKEEEFVLRFDKSEAKKE
ncbi:hypothetical protein HYX13_05365 [Candidatus Woesearchaeota archaeon]|nr:hypothetical protein [Candidatus Woesearchaeota archaeon]